ncbi:hypothetical protein DSD19_02550 [Rhodovulum sp. BSW8]|uniref:Hemolysin type calcium-binding protein n=1 Tax=Rhodovulum visakhapatnamense TaxID=364297 RepID=A0A4R8F886_9RHOB|nr:MULTISPECIES: calcium-binding protein [Rhodovulum]RBO54292.1 hypothetical protein DSD19_02550 [Rhodovulum sp. BSW8]TDX21656.1 hemolysin type calcium-binding protein [Rhodovulum visakhapatnamense]
MAFVNGTDGNDYIVPNYDGGPWYYADTVYLKAGNDYVDTSSGDDYIDAGSGNDTVNAGDGDDHIFGGDGNDHLKGGMGNDVIHGGEHDDTINGGQQDDMLYGDGGNDTFQHTGSDGWDCYFGGSGDDTILVEAVSSYSMWGQIKIQSLDSVEHITNEDTTKDVDILVDGEIDFSNTEITGIRHILGQDANDTIIGSKENNSINGGAGNDILMGFEGSDVLTGGAGADQFVFMQDKSVDRVMDFTDGEDMLVFSGATSLQLFDHNGSALLYMNNDTYVLLEGVDPSLIDGSDIFFI